MPYHSHTLSRGCNCSRTRWFTSGSVFISFFFVFIDDIFIPVFEGTDLAKHPFIGTAMNDKVKCNVVWSKSYSSIWNPFFVCLCVPFNTFRTIHDPITLLFDAAICHVWNISCLIVSHLFRFDKLISQRMRNKSFLTIKTSFMCYTLLYALFLSVLLSTQFGCNLMKWMKNWISGTFIITNTFSLFIFQLIQFSFESNLFFVYISSVLWLWLGPVMVTWWSTCTT